MSRRARGRVVCTYCGPDNYLPYGYDRLGGRYECGRKFFAVGMFQERRKWQRRLGMPVDPPYISPCPRSGPVRWVRRSTRRSRGRSRSSSRSRSRTRSRTFTI